MVGTPGVTRQAILDALAGGAVTDRAGRATAVLHRQLGLPISPTAVTQHLAKLERDGLVRRVLAGKRCTVIALVAHDPSSPTAKPTAPPAVSGCPWCAERGRAGCALHRDPSSADPHDASAAATADASCVDRPDASPVATGDASCVDVARAVAAGLALARDEREEFVGLQASYATLVDELADHKQRLLEAWATIGELRRVNELLGHRLARSA